MSQASSKGTVCSRVLQIATMVQASSPTTTNTVNNPRSALQGCGQGKANKMWKKNKDTVSNKKTREGWNYTKLQSWSNYGKRTFIY